MDGDTACRTLLMKVLNSVPVKDFEVIIPLRRIGEGCSRMREFAPRLHVDLILGLKEIAYPLIEWDYNA